MKPSTCLAALLLLAGCGDDTPDPCALTTPPSVWVGPPGKDTGWQAYADGDEIALRHDGMGGAYYLVSLQIEGVDATSSSEVSIEAWLGEVMVAGFCGGAAWEGSHEEGCSISGDLRLTVDLEEPGDLEGKELELRVEVTDACRRKAERTVRLRSTVE